MKKIYPNFYDIVPMPTSDGYILLKCPTCQQPFLYHAKVLDKNKHKCPYCGELHSLQNFYENAYLDVHHYYHMEAIKNLLELIDIKIEITENDLAEEKQKYQVNFINVKNPSEKEMQAYIQYAFKELQKRAEEKTLEIEMKIPIFVKDMIDETQFKIVDMSCCNQPIKIKEDATLSHCVYCNEDSKII